VSSNDSNGSIHLCPTHTDDSMAEEETTMISAMSRQFLRTHRPFKAVIMDRTGKPILWVGDRAPN